jgi:hypothetical protein
MLTPRYPVDRQLVIRLKVSRNQIQQPRGPAWDV